MKNIAIACLFSLYLCSSAMAETPLAAAADDWTELFNRTEGWIGADGIFTANLDGTVIEGIEKRPKQRTVFVFSDTLVGRVDPETRKQSEVRMPNHSFALLAGNEPKADKIEFLYGRANNKDGNTPGLPIKPNGEGQWYWLSECSVLQIGREKKLYAFLLRMMKSDDDEFRHLGVDLLRLDIKDGLPDFGSAKIIEDDPTEPKWGVFRGDQRNSEITFGFGIGMLENVRSAGVPNPDGYIYIYGYRDAGDWKRPLIAARCMPNELERSDRWRYYIGNEKWSPRMTDAVGITGDVSTELSVTPILSGLQKGKYALIYTPGTRGSKIALRIGESPVGPFGPERIVFEEPESKRLGEGVYAYNAKAHPVLSRTGELLISYNINSTDSTMRIFREADIYRPRFIRLDWDRMHESQREAMAKEFSSQP